AEFCATFLTRAVKANATYQGGYYLSAALARPMVASKLAALAAEMDADVIVHGFRGNDQVRMDMAVSVLTEARSVAAPRSRDPDPDALPEGVARGVYSTSENVWGKSTECGALEDPTRQADGNVFSFTCPLDQAAAAPSYVKLGFRQGVPDAMNDERLPFL